jgi:hypothetical protein
MTAHHVFVTGGTGYVGGALILGCWTAGMRCAPCCVPHRQGRLDRGARDPRQCARARIVSRVIAPADTFVHSSAHLLKGSQIIRRRASLSTHCALPAESARMRISRTLYLQPLGEFAAGQSPALDKLQAFASAFFALPLVVLPVLDIAGSCKVLAHEMTHMFVVEHCTYFHCLMNGSNHLTESKARPMHLCAVDLRKLHASTASSGRLVSKPTRREQGTRICR